MRRQVLPLRDYVAWLCMPEGARAQVDAGHSAGDLLTLIERTAHTARYASPSGAVILATLRNLTALRAGRTHHKAQTLVCKYAPYATGAGHATGTIEYAMPALSEIGHGVKYSNERVVEGIVIDEHRPTRERVRAFSMPAYLVPEIVREFAPHGVKPAIRWSGATLDARLLHNLQRQNAEFTTPYNPAG